MNAARCVKGFDLGDVGFGQDKVNDQPGIVLLERIIALAFPENAASIRVMEKIGMRYEKMTHIWRLDLVKYEITRDMYRRLAPLETH